MLSSTTADKHLLESVQCFLTTQESFGIALLAPMFQSAFGGVHERTKVADSLSWISATLVQLLLASKNLPELTKSGAVAKTSKLASRYLRPPEPLLSVDSFDQLYANFSENYTTFFEAWLHSRRSLRQSLADPYYATLMTARYRQHSGVFLYLYSLNELWPTMAAVSPPLYRRNGVPAMAYAGLGFQFARQLVRSIDDRGRTVDSAGRNVSWWQQLGERSLCRYDKATSPEERRQLADLFALSLARDAMKTSAPRTSGSSQPARLPSLEKLTEEQTFYVSYCSHYCGEPRGKLMCDLAMNDSHFPGAFSCQHEQPRDLSSCLVV
ncbi:neprilysin-2-like [Haemaphysalis longicornis]